MDEIILQLRKLADDVASATAKIDIPKLATQLDELRQISQAPDFWQDNLAAQEKMRQISKLESRVNPWQNLEKQISEALEIARLGDHELTAELQKSLDDAKELFEELKESLKFSEPYDDHDAIISIHAGAGGTDAQDWAQMLFRMYSRFAEKDGFKLKLIDESRGEEAGLKSVTFEVYTVGGNDFAYGRLKNEHGVHRLVRLSPFNADNLRQTSFAKVEVVPKIDSPTDIEIDEADLKIDVYRSGGKGGQSVNTTDSAVRVTHTPTGISVSIQNERSQQQNKNMALTILRSKLAQLQLEQHQSNLNDIKGPNTEAAWGNQIRNYVLHPYKQVKDLRSQWQSSEPEKILDGQLQPLIASLL